MVPESLKFIFQYQKCSNPAKRAFGKMQESALNGEGRGDGGGVCGECEGGCFVTNPYSDKSFQYS